MVSKKERSEYAAALGRAGGKARAKKMSPAERSEAARKAVQARWERKKGGSR